MKTLQPISPKDRDPNLVMIGVPSVRGGLWDLVTTVISLEKGESELAAAGSPYRFEFLRAAGQGIAKARNMITFAARCSPASKLIMIDADIKPTAAHFLRLASSSEKLVGVLYPKKNLTGLCWVGEFKEGTPKTMGPRGEWPMEHVGSGMIKVDMSVVDELISAFPARAYMNDEDEPSSGIAEGQWMHDLWGMGVVNAEWAGTNKHPARRVYPRYMTEDYFFSHLYSSIGGKLWSDPACEVGHVGEVDFLELYNMVERRCDEARRQYKADLQAVGFEVPLLEKLTIGPGVRIARVN